MAAKLETQESFVEEINFNDLEFQKIVGKGAFGVVSQARWLGRVVAVKMIETEEEIKAFKVEVTQLSRVNHPNIVKLYGACTAGPVCLVMEYAEGGSLYNVLHGNPQPIYTAAHAMSWALQSAKGVAYLHAMQPKALIHRDLKPANLLLMAGGTELKICDFGTACDIQTYMTNNKGSAAWMAPEVFEGSLYSEKCDVFSWGIILWEVISRRKPFDEIGGPAFRIMWAVHQGTRPPKIRGLPKPLDALMNRCWSKDHAQRPSMEEVVRIMQPLLQYFKGKEEEPLVYPVKEERVEEPHMSMNLLDLEGATQDTNLTQNSELSSSRASTFSDTIIQAQEKMPVIKRDTGKNTKLRDLEYEKRRRSADLLQYHGSKDEEEAKYEPKALVKKGHQRSSSHGHIVLSSTPSQPTAAANPTSTTSNITISVVSPSPPILTTISHSKTAPNLTEFDPLKQRANSDESHRLLNVTDATGMERPRSGSQGNMAPPLLATLSACKSSDGSQQNRQDKPMRSVSLDQKTSHSRVNDDIVSPMVYMTLDHHLQPLPPNPKSKASVEIFDRHCEAAQEYLRMQTELALLHQRKKELADELDQGWKDQQASFKIIEEFNKLQAERESLLQVHRGLRASLDLIRAQVQRKHSLNRRV